MSPLARRLVWFFALVGLAASLTSLYVHTQLLANSSYTSFCDVNATVSCTSAYLSRYGSFVGVPVALFGVIWFAFVLVCAAIEVFGPPAFKESFPGYLFIACTVGLAVVLYLGYAAFFVLKAVCLMCLTTYAAVIGLFIVSGIATSLPMTTLPRRFVSDLRALVARPAALVVLVLFLVGAASAIAFFPKEAAGGATPQAAVQQPALDQSEVERWWTSQPRTTMPVPSDGAAVVIVKFTDLQCPSCGVSYVQYRPILAKYQGQYPGAVKFVSKDFPLQPECNSTIQRPMHLAACDAAVAVHLARQNGKGEALEDYFYTHQAMLTPASVREYAATVGGVQNFDAGYQRAIDQVKTDVGLGKLLAVRVTPTFFINGVRSDGALDPRVFDIVIGLELKKAGK